MFIPKFRSKNFINNRYLNHIHLSLSLFGFHHFVIISQLTSFAKYHLVINRPRGCHCSFYYHCRVCCLCCFSSCFYFGLKYFRRLHHSRNPDHKARRHHLLYLYGANPTPNPSHRLVNLCPYQKLTDLGSRHPDSLGPNWTVHCLGSPLHWCFQDPQRLFWPDLWRFLNQGCRGWGPCSYPHEFHLGQSYQGYYYSCSNRLPRPHHIHHLRPYAYSELQFLQISF